MRRTVEELLQSVSDILFPEDAGERLVAIDSRGPEGDTPLHVMAWRNDLDAVEMLIRAGADVNAVGDMGETPLHVAVSQGNTSVIAAMVAAGARDDIRCEFGDTPRERAHRNGIPASAFSAR